MKQTKETLKTYFETGDKPTQGQFTDLIDSFVTEQDVTEIQKKNSEREYAHESLFGMARDGRLTAGQTYILGDYQTKYCIEGSCSANIEKTIENKAIVSGYSLFDPPLLDLNIGDEVVVKSLPTGYTGSIAVGDRTTITANVLGYYMRFANGMHYVQDIAFQYSIRRYASIAKDATILDANQKPVMTPAGVINTQVHDGTDYMNMKASENKAVPFEKILLTAISPTKFSLQAESITFPGEILEYDFEDREVKNENGKIIGSRNGFIKRRISADKKIDVNKDWRVQRYRRYMLSETDWKNFTMNVNSGTHTLYYMNGNHAVTAANTGLKEAHKYVMPFVEAKNFFQDFSLGGAAGNSFITGTTNVGAFVYGDMMEKFKDEEFKMSAFASSPTSAKDFFILPTDRSYVTTVVVKKLENTVFLTNPSQYSSSNTIDVKIDESIFESTFLAGAMIQSTSGSRSASLTKITAIDNLRLNNSGSITNLCVLATGSVTNAGELYYLTIGGMLASATPFGATYIDVSFDVMCRIRHTMIGGKRVDRTVFANVQTNKCLFAFLRGQYLKVTDSIMCLTGIMIDSDFFTNNLTLDTTMVNDYQNKKAYGYWYSNNVPLVQKKIVMNNLGEMVYPVIESTNQNTLRYTTYTSPR